MNLLGIPCKASLPCDLAEALRAHIATNFRDAHTDQFKADYTVLRKLRTALTFKPGGSQEVHTSILHQLITYHAQLVFILNKFPANVGVSFEWLPVFAKTSGSLSASLPGMLPTTIPIVLADVHYERASTLFNIAAMYASLGAGESRTEQEGIKRALSYFQNAAGCFALLSTEIVRLIRIAPGEPDPCSPDLSIETLAAFEALCLAQAQECFWQKAVMDRLKNGTIAKLSARVAELYATSLDNAQKAKGAGGIWPTFSFPIEMLNHIMIKKAHFAAVTQYRKACDDLSANKYGDEVARLRAAENALKEGMAISRKSVTNAILDDLRGLQGVIADNLARAVKDNDLIYLDPVPSPASLAAVVPAAMTKGTVPTAVAKPLDSLHDAKDGLGRPVFETLVPYAVHQALSVYSDRVETLIRTEIATRIEELSAIAASTLQSLGLPGSIQALEAPIALPPTLVRKAAEVRAEAGPTKLRTLLRDVQRLAATSQATLAESVKLLDAEEAEDIANRRQLSSARHQLTSTDTGIQLRARTNQYAQTLKQARDSDVIVRQKFVEGERQISNLARPEAELQTLVPSSATRGGQFTTHESRTRQTSAVRQLRKRLEQLDEITATGTNLLSDARRLAQADDIRPVILRNATSQDVHVAAFEPLLEKELGKYAPYEDNISELASKQEDALEDIRTANEAFIAARHADASLKERENVLQELDAAYHKYKEVSGNLSEGLRFYNEFGQMLIEHKSACQEWVKQRRREAYDNVTALTTATSQVALGSEHGSVPWQPSEGIKFSTSRQC